MQGSNDKGKTFQDLLAMLLSNSPDEETTTVVDIARKKSPEYATRYLSQEIRKRLATFGEDHTASSELRIQGLFADLAAVLLMAIRKEGELTRSALQNVMTEMMERDHSQHQTTRTLLNNQAAAIVNLGNLIAKPL